MSVINVHIGEIKIAKRGETLKAILGSCVGIGLIWRSKKICGLAHCLLPEIPAPSFAIEGRYVDQALPSLLAMMKVRKEDYPEIEAILAGGGNMTQPNAPASADLVGAANLRVAARELKKLGIRLIHEEGGGEAGRQVTIHATECVFQIETIPRIIVAV